VRQVFIDGWNLQVKFGYMGSSMFKELVRKYTYRNGWFYIPYCYDEELMEVAKLLSPDEEMPLRMCKTFVEMKTEEQKQVERVSRFLRDKYGVEPVKVRLSRDAVQRLYYVTLPYLTKEQWLKLKDRKKEWGEYLFTETELVQEGY